MTVSKTVRGGSSPSGPAIFLTTPSASLRLVSMAENGFGTLIDEIELVEL